MRATSRAVLTVLTGAALLASGPASSQDAWNPFEQQDRRAREQSATAGQTIDRRAGPSTRDPRAWLDDDARPRSNAAAVSVERGELQPVRAGDGSGLPLELWQGLDVQTIHEHLEHLESPPPSLALQALWQRIWTSSAPAPTGGAAGELEALRVDALYRYGLFDDVRSVLAKSVEPTLPAAAALQARALVGVGDHERGCDRVRGVVRHVSELPDRLRTGVLLLSGFCAAVHKNTAAVGIAAELVHEQRADAPVAIAVLDALAAGTMPSLSQTSRISLLDYRFLELAGATSQPELASRAEPALLAVLALDQRTDAQTRLACGEAASRHGMLTPRALAEAYRAVAFAPAQLADPLAGGDRPEYRRALLFKAAEAEQSPSARARLVRTLLAEVRGAGDQLFMAAMVGPMVADMPPSLELEAFAETAIEALLADGRYDQARSWIELGGMRRSDSGLLHWLALADIADAKAGSVRGASLGHMEQLAVHGRLDSLFLHLLATVLDALDYQVPIPLWEAASRSAQPTSGYLPETGILSRLQDAARKREVARTVLLVARTLGPKGAEGAHLIALGDAIRALKRAGLEADARRLGFEALFAGWPRLAVTGANRWDARAR